jgi:predicted dehydrogenase
MKTLVLGCGSIGKKHALNLKKLKLSQIVLCDTNENNLKSLGKMIGTPFQYTDYKAAINAHSDIQHAIICTPSSDHILPSIYLAKNKINLLIEKPLSNSLVGTKILREIAKKNRVIIMMGHSFFFDSNYTKLKSLITSQRLGKIYSVNFTLKQFLPEWHLNSNYENEYTARKELGGGVLLTLGSHIFYLIEWLFGKITDDFTSFTTRQGSLKINVDDSFYFLGETKNKTIVHINSNFISRVYRHDLTLDCEKGVVEFNFLKNSINIIFSNGKTKTIKIKHRHDRYYYELKHFLNLKKSASIDKNLSLDSGINFLKTIKKIPYYD